MGHPLQPFVKIRHLMGYINSNNHHRYSYFYCYCCYCYYYYCCLSSFDDYLESKFNNWILSAVHLDPWCLSKGQFQFACKGILSQRFSDMQARRNGLIGRHCLVYFGIILKGMIYLGWMESPATFLQAVDPKIPFCPDWLIVLLITT